MNSEILESASRHLNESFSEFWIHLTLETGLTQEEIETKVNRLLNELLSTTKFMSRNWCYTDRFSSYKMTILSDMTYKGFKILNLVKIFDKICPRFRLDYISHNLSLLLAIPHTEVCFDVYLEDTVYPTKEW